MPTPNHITSGDVERRARINANARDALRRIKSGQTYEDWRMVGEKLMLVTEEVMADLHILEWDPQNKRLVREIAYRFEGWEREVSNEAPMGKDERGKLRELMTNPVYHSWYMTLPGPERRRLNHPSAIIAKYKARHPDPNNVRLERRPTRPQVEVAIDALTAHLRELEPDERTVVATRLGLARTDNGSLFDLRRDTAADIGRTIADNISRRKFDDIVKAAKARYGTRPAAAG
jgi:hypothetical protein